MILGTINCQKFSLNSTDIVADTIDFIEARFVFLSDDWDGLEKWAHFARDSEVYDIRLTDDHIRKEDHLNLSAGKWKVYIHGNEFRGGEVVQRITTNMITLYVEPTGTLDGEPFPEMPASVTEQILARLARLEIGGGTGGGGGGMSYGIGYGLTLSTDLVLSAEVGKDSFKEISNAKVQEIFNKVMMEG